MGKLRKKRGIILRVFSVLMLCFFWWVISLFFPPTFIPSPFRIFKKIAEIIVTGEFFYHMYGTLMRVVLGFLWAFVMSIIVGVLMGSNRVAEELLDIEVLVGLTIPGLAWAVIALIWFGAKEISAVFAIFIVVLPMITVNMWQGTKALDGELIEMGKAFKATRRSMMRDIIIPQLLPYLFSVVRFGFAMAWKIVVVSEMLGLSSGIGFKIDEAFEIFSMDGVLAWTISFTLVMLLMEFGIVKVIEDRLMRWRPALKI